MIFELLKNKRLCIPSCHAMSSHFPHYLHGCPHTYTIVTYKTLSTGHLLTEGGDFLITILQKMMTLNMPLIDGQVTFNATLFALVRTSLKIHCEG